MKFNFKLYILYILFKNVYTNENYIQSEINNQCIKPIGEYNGAQLILGNCEAKFEYINNNIKYKNKYCVDVSGGNSNNGNIIKLWNCLDNNNQKFHINNNNIIWINKNKCFHSLNNKIVIWDCLNNSNQKFLFNLDIENNNNNNNNNFKWESSNNYIGQNWCKGIIPKSGWTLKKNFKNIEINVLSYNLYWWNLYGKRKGNGNSAGNLIVNSNNKKQFDVMGFQECDDINRILHDTNLINKFSSINSGYALGLLYNNIWKLLDKGSIPIAEDRHDQYFGKRIVSYLRLQHKITNNILFFINHHGPLPVNTGGLCGCEAVAYNILKVIGEKSLPNDSIIMTGDFNSNSNSKTIEILKIYLYHIYSSKDLGGIDHIFASSNNIINMENLGNGGSDHNAIRAEILL